MGGEAGDAELAASINSCADDLLDEDGPSSFAVAERLYELAASNSQPRSVGVPDGWQDIATAPNDGTPHVRGLHVYAPDGKHLYWEEIAGHIDTEDGAFYSEGDVSGWAADDFTHWHALAAAPAPSPAMHSRDVGGE